MVKFYHIIGFEGKQTPWGDPTPAHYMGKTADLLFKTEPDKTIDLDDGSTEVGSEKLSVSFSLLEKLQNPWPLAELWLVPVCQDYNMENPEIIRIHLLGSDYHLEAKSGEFDKILFSANLRYPVTSPAYTVSEDYFQDNSMVLIRCYGDARGETIYYKETSFLAATDPADWMVQDCCAFFRISNQSDPRWISVQALGATYTIPSGPGVFMVYPGR